MISPTRHEDAFYPFFRLFTPFERFDADPALDVDGTLALLQRKWCGVQGYGRSDRSTEAHYFSSVCFTIVTDPIECCYHTVVGLEVRYIKPGQSPVLMTGNISCHARYALINLYATGSVAWTLMPSSFGLVGRGIALNGTAPRPMWLWMKEDVMAA